MSLPLCVDLDGTLVRTDLLFESAALLLRNKPWLAFALPVWLARGRPQLKREIASRVHVNAALLPYNAEFVEWLIAEHERGRTLVLATASDQLLADDIAKHLNIFDSVAGSDSSVNLKSEHKLQALTARYGREFSYAGNSSAGSGDLEKCEEAVVVNANASTTKAARALSNVVRVFPSESISYTSIRAAFRPRISQLILTACIALTMVTRNSLWAVAGLAICCLITGLSLTRDLLSLEQDRAIPDRAQRPLASGVLPISIAFFLAPALLLAGVAGTIYIAARNAGYSFP